MASAVITIHVLVSLALQHGVALETLRHAMTRGAAGEPASILGTVVDCIPMNAFSGKNLGTDL